MENTRNPRAALKGLIWIGAPVVVYYPLRLLGLPIVTALAAATGIAVLRIAYVALRHRRFDGIATLMAGIFGIGLVLTLVTGDPRVMLLKDSVTTGLIALAFLGSCLARRPLMYVLIRRMDESRGAEAERRWSTDSAYRGAVTLISAVWGVVLLAEAATRAVLVYTLPVDTVFGISHLLTLVAVGLALGWTALYGARRKRNAAAKSAAAGQPA
jgi:intracellular septation protein A